MTEKHRPRILFLCTAVFILAATAVLMMLPGWKRNAADARSFGRGNALMAMDYLSYYCFIRQERSVFSLYYRNLKDTRMRQKVMALLNQLKEKP